MKTKLLISTITIVAIVAAGAAGIIAENKIGIVGRMSPTAGETLVVEFGSLFEFIATEQFASAPEYMLVDLSTDAMQMATEARQRLYESQLDANDVQQGVSDILLGIAGLPVSSKDVFMLDMVSMPILLGANYGKFAAMRSGAIEPGDVNKIVTAHAATALDGFLKFLSDLAVSGEDESEEAAENGKNSS